VGPCVTNAAIRFIRIEDGIVNLPSGDMQLSTLDSLGFSSYSNWDLSHLATDCFQRMLVATQQFKDVLIPTKGRHRYDRWRRNARIYRSLFRRRQLTYLIIIAVRS
jgi:hypothetical protein